MAMAASEERTFHPQFYLDDRHVVFLVETVFFKVPRRHFSYHSPIFRDMFSMPTEKGRPVEGDDPEHPVILEGDTVKDFEALIAYFIRDFDAFKSTKSEWISILRLSHKYQMTQVQQIARQELSKHPFPNSFEKIALCERFGIPLDWAKDAVSDICTRVMNVRVDEGRELSRDWFAAILWARQGEMRHISSISRPPSAEVGWGVRHLDGYGMNIPVALRESGVSENQPQTDDDDRIVRMVIGALDVNSENAAE